MTDDFNENEDLVETESSDELDDVASDEENTNEDDGGYVRAASGRDAFARRAGNRDYYNQQIKRNQERVQNAKAVDSSSRKMVDGEEKDKNIFDKVNDKVGLASSNIGLASSKLDNLRSKAFAATHPGEAAKMAVKGYIKSKLTLKVKLIIAGVICGLLSLFALISVFVVIFGDEENGQGGGVSCVNLPAVDSVCRTVTPGSYPTVSLDEYVAGVVTAEIGGYTDEGFNTYKAFAIAARSYALANAKKGDNGNCTVPVGPSFQAYTDKYNSDILQASNDTSGVVLIRNNKIYSSQYDALCIEHEDSVNYYLCQGGTGEEHLTVNKDWILDRKGSAYVEWAREQVHGNGMSQNGAWYLANVRSWDYIKTLEYFYGDEGVTLASINGSSSVCSSSFNGNFKPLETYNLRHNNLSVLNRTLTTAEIDSLNNYINKEVDKAGYGTGSGVAAAGQALVYWLEQQGYFLGYYYGGGQIFGDSHFVGVNSEWGSTWGDDPHEDGSFDQQRIYYGMDCVGFTAWAVRTACNPDFDRLQFHRGGIIEKLPVISFSEAKPGDMIDGPNHIIMVIKNNGDGTVIAAEETGGTYEYGGGLVFSLVSASSHSDYSVIDMSSYYKSFCNTSREEMNL